MTSLSHFLENRTLMDVWAAEQRSRDAEGGTAGTPTVGEKRKGTDDGASDAPASPATNRGCRGLVVASASDSISAGLSLLHEHRISGLPVHEDGDPRRFLGFVDTMDILAFLSDSYREHGKEGPPHLFHPRKLQETIFAKPLSTLVNRSGRDPYWPVPPTTTLAQAVGTFFRWAIHRLPIEDAKQQLVGTVSQLDVIRCLHRDLAPDHPVRSLTLAQLGLDRHNAVISVPDTTTVIDVITTLQTNKVRSVLIVDAATQPLACFSATDAHFEPTTFFELEQVALEVLLAANPTLGPPITVPPTETLGKVLACFSDLGLHRVFVRDEVTKRVSSVVSLTDVLRALTQEAADPSLA